MGAMPYIYATALSGDIVKLGRCIDQRERPYAARCFYVERVQLLALWETSYPDRDEKRAQHACAQWHARGELYRVPTDWLDIDHPLVACVSAVLGAPIKVKPRRRHGGILGNKHKKTHLKSGRAPWPESRAKRGLEPHFRRKAT